MIQQKAVLVTADRISNYPLVIEPTAESLEAIGADGPIRLRRIQTHIVLTLIPGLTVGMVHFFGESSKLGDNQAVLCYNAGGRLQTVLVQEEQAWEKTTLPHEATGDAILQPSVRLVFKDERTRAVFVHHLEQIRSKKTHNPTLAILMEKLIELRQIDVWTEEP